MNALQTSVSRPAETKTALKAMVTAEWINVRSTPTAPALLAGSAVMAAASCVANLATIETERLSDVETIQLAMHASTVATLVFALVAGLVLSTSDFRFGRIDQLLLSGPRRPRLLTAKALIGAGLGVVYGLIGAIVAVGSVSLFFKANGAALDIGSTAFWQPLVGVAIGAALFGALGIGIGFAVQNQPAAIAGSLAYILIIEPTALIGIPQLGRWLPGASGLALTLSPDPNLFGQIAGGVLLLTWTAAALVVGKYRMIGTDI